LHRPAVLPGDCFHSPSGEGEITARPKNVRNNITFTDGPAWLNQGPFATVAEAVQALSTSPYYHNLVRVAARRLQRLAKYPPGQRLCAVHDPEDYTNEALRLVLLGESEPGKGRRTQARHLATLKHFLNHLQGILQSRISSELKQFVREGEVLTLTGDPQTPAETDVAVDTVHAAEVGEVAAHVFADLKGEDDVSAARQATLDSWEEDWPRLEAVPKRGLNKRQRRQLREEAEARLRYEARLAGDLLADGSELLL
jgi:hypothetical protein